jgi:hypothetical protein
MAALADLIAWRDKLLQARLTGVRTVQFAQGDGGSRLVNYKSDAEMRDALRNVEAMIAAANTGNAPSTVHFVTRKDTPHAHLRSGRRGSDFFGSW